MKVMHWRLRVLQSSLSESPHLSRFNIWNIMCLNCFLSIDFILDKSWWFEKAKLIKQRLWSAYCSLVVTLKNKNVYLTNKQMLQTLIKNEMKYKHFAITHYFNSWNSSISCFGRRGKEDWIGLYRRTWQCNVCVYWFNIHMCFRYKERHDWCGNLL